MEQVTKKNETETGNNNLPAVQEKNVADNVMNKVKAFEEAGTLKIPADYSAPNAIRAAWLILLDMKNSQQKPILEVVTKESVANALLAMIVQGLNPVKNQCSFIAYGNSLTLQREYAGNIALAKRLSGLQSIISQTVFDGDEFEYSIDPETGIKKVNKHVQTLESMGSGKVKGAYAILTLKDGSKAVEIMSMQQIEKSWKMGAAKGESPAHRNFPDQMAMKTVINRATKLLINSSDDSDLFNEEGNVIDDPKSADVKAEIADKSSKIDVDLTAKEDKKVEPKGDKTNGQLVEKSGPGF